jgi:hypothetical protein
MTASVPDFGDLSTNELAKQINDEYSVILDSERSNLQRALAIGAKLKALRPRIAPNHGDWQAKLKLHCPKLSYETATLYIRLHDNLEALEKHAAGKSVETTDLTIEEARKAIAKKGTGGNASGGTKRQQNKKPDEPASQPSAAAPPPEEIVKALAPDKLFGILKDHYEADQLRDLERMLRVHLNSRPKASPDAGLDIPQSLDRRQQGSMARV